MFAGVSNMKTFIQVVCLALILRTASSALADKRKYDGGDSDSDDVDDLCDEFEKFCATNAKTTKQAKRMKIEEDPCNQTSTKALQQGKFSKVRADFCKQLDKLDEPSAKASKRKGTSGEVDNPGCKRLRMVCSNIREHPLVPKISSSNSTLPHNPCLSNPCLHGGSCHVTAITGGYTCTCAEPGYDPKDRCHYCRRGYFGWGCAFKCGICPERECRPESGCASCQAPWSPPGACDQVDCTQVERNPDLRLTCSPGYCMNNTCVCPPGYHRSLNCKKFVGTTGLLRCDRTSQINCKHQVNAEECFVVRGREVCTCGLGQTLVSFGQVRGQDSTKPECLTKCVTGSENCLHGTCNGGACVCDLGFNNTYCDMPCPTGTWGLRCIGRCSLFCRVYPCERDSGKCLEGCLPGYTGESCETALSTEQSTAYARTQFTFQGRWDRDLEIAGLQTHTGETIWYKTCRVTSLGVRAIIPDPVELSLTPQCPAIFEVFREGSVIVKFTIPVDTNKTKGLNVKNHIVRLLKQAAESVSNPQGYVLNTKSIRVSSVAYPAKPDPQGSRQDKSDDVNKMNNTITVVVAVVGTILVTSICLVIAFAVRYRKKPRLVIRPGGDRRR